LKRVLALILGVALAAGAFYALVSAHPRAGARVGRSEIDAGSRAKLERVIERADPAAGAKR